MKIHSFCFVCFFFLSQTNHQHCSIFKTADVPTVSSRRQKPNIGFLHDPSSYYRFQKRQTNEPSHAGRPRFRRLATKCPGNYSTPRQSVARIFQPSSSNRTQLFGRLVAGLHCLRRQSRARVVPKT